MPGDPQGGRGRGGAVRRVRARPAALRGQGSIRPTGSDKHFPERKNKILGRIRDIRAGKLNNSDFHTRMSGTGPMAEQLSQMFDVAKRRAGITKNSRRSVAITSAGRWAESAAGVCSADRAPQRVIFVEEARDARAVFVRSDGGHRPARARPRGPSTARRLVARDCIDAAIAAASSGGMNGSPSPCTTITGT
jgi:hypothetical protein